MRVYSFILSETEGVTVGGRLHDGAFDLNSSIKEPNAIYYPNGGFEIISLPSSSKLFAVGRQLKILTQQLAIPILNAFACRTTISNMVLSNRPPHSTNIEVMDESSDKDADMINVEFSIDCKDHYVIGNSSTQRTKLCVVNKVSKKIQFITPDKFPASRRTFCTNYPDRVGNTIFSIDGNTKTIQSYNFETLQYREVQYDDSELGGFFEKGTSFKNDPPTYIKYGTRGSDGKPVTVEINIETGATNVKVDPDNRETIILVRIS